MLVEFEKMSSLISFDSKNMWAISNIDIDVARDLGLTNMKKDQRFAGQIEKEVNRLYRNWILALSTFMKLFWKMYDNGKMTKNVKIRQDIDFR